MIIKHGRRTRDFKDEPKLTHREVEILKYLWRWKLGSTASLHESLYRPNSAYSAYRHLYKFETRGFVECMLEAAGGVWVWTLTKKGFTAVRDKLGDINGAQFVSGNILHDRVVQAFQLGEWSRLQLPQVEFFTHQELLQKDVNAWPQWVPQNYSHRPCGYTHFHWAINGATTFAYEVEQHMRSSTHYKAIFDFYDSVTGIKHVIWMLPSAEVFKKIQDARQERDESRPDVHGFVLRCDFEKLGWDAVVQSGKSETLGSLRDLYRENVGDLLADLVGVCRTQLSVNVHSISTKVIGKTRAYRKLSLG